MNDKRNIVSENIYIAKQPILNHNSETFGYELLFRALDHSGNLQALFEDELLATAKVLVNALNHFGMTSLVEDNLAFVNIDQEFLLDPIIFSIPKERFVLEILESTVINDKTIARVKKLKDLGYKFALDDVHCNDDFIENFTPIFPYLDVLKLDVSLIKENTLEKHLENFKQFDFQLLAEKVETKEDYELYKSYGCTLFQGYFFAKPDIVVKKSIDPEYKKIFQLINMLVSEYTEINEIVEELESEVELTIQLLRFINSSYMGVKTEIKSVYQVITLLGRQPLKQWLLLIAFSKSMVSESSFNKNPIIELALNRSKIMSALARNLSHDSHEASFIGVLSLVDVLFKVPIATILNEINVTTNVQNALLKREGDLGKLLELVISIEKFDISKTEEILDDLHLSNVQLSEILQKSYAKA